MKAGTAEGGSLQALLGLLINQGVSKGSVRVKGTLCGALLPLQHVWSARADKARQAVSKDAIHHVRGGHVHSQSVLVLVYLADVAIFSSHVSSTPNNESRLCVASPLQAVAAFDGMVVTCNGCDKEFASSSGRSKHSRRMNCGDYKRRQTLKHMSAEEKKVHESKRKHLALRQALAVRFTYTIMTSGGLSECSDLNRIFLLIYVLLQFRQAASCEKKYAETKSSWRKRPIDDQGDTASGDEGPFEGPFPPVPLTDEMGHAEGEHSVDGVSILCLPYLHRK